MTREGRFSLIAMPRKNNISAANQVPTPVEIKFATP